MESNSLTQSGGAAFGDRDYVPLPPTKAEPQARFIRPLNSDQRLLKCQSSSIRDLLSKAQLYSKSTQPIMLVAESGLGAEQLARHIHELRGGQSRALFRICCDEIAVALAGCADWNRLLPSPSPESTYLFDGVDELPSRWQTAFARWIDDNVSLDVDDAAVRVISISKPVLVEFVHCGAFRRELFDLLNVHSLAIPPLCERLEDIGTLVNHFANQQGSSIRFESSAIEVLSSHSWPGNDVELRGAVLDICVMAARQVITADDVRKYWRPPMKSPASLIEGTSLEDAETRLILETVARCDGNKTEAAARLGVSTRTLHNKFQKYRRMGLVD